MHQNAKNTFRFWTPFLRGLKLIIGYVTYLLHFGQRGSKNVAKMTPKTKSPFVLFLGGKGAPLHLAFFWGSKNEVGFWTTF